MLHELLSHIMREKIEFATGIKIPKNSKKDNTNMIQNHIIQEEVITEKKDGESIEIDIKNDDNSSEIMNINGFIKKETDKALLIQFDNNSEVWIPKSKIHSSYNAKKNLVQTFIIDRWILRSNKVVS